MLGDGGQRGALTDIAEHLLSAIFSRREEYRDRLLITVAFVAADLK